MNETWHIEHSLHIPARAETIWAAFSDVATWTAWNAGIERIELDGPFATGTWFTMKPPGQDAFRSQLIDVRDNLGFTDVTRVDDLVVTVVHRLEPSAGGTRVVYAMDAVGPGASEIGPAIASDFPDVLAALARKIASP